MLFKLEIIEVEGDFALTYRDRFYPWRFRTREHAEYVADNLLRRECWMTETPPLGGPAKPISLEDLGL